MEPSYYAIIPANVRYDSALIPAAKLLYGEITALCNKDGYCWAENAYFAELYGVSIFTISRWISQLQNGGYIDMEIIKSEGNKRKITLAENVKRSCGKAQKVLTKNAIALAEKRKSIYRMNNTINNTINREENALAFFEKNSPSEWENFLMRFRKKFTDPEWVKFCEIFDCKIIEEEIEFTSRKIGARLTRFALNYLENNSKGEASKAQNVQEMNTNHPSRRKLD
ncbi:hypothetical protein ASG38_15090 [Flavobacterium sp. Leaf359]|uniref:helix-turn-helix domain-containing protein n=1 Tax=Flavobacterium sp. Leaf359 TaxID=1736351 RepID=UPI0006FAEAE1|nr:helix-turn-helix domain-containing protein [Flavobacterium sp. Leaf359]KQS45932.1 hypothetical protein ASG38_15090 [Flavobacterium sp. Leaf359]